MDRLIDISVPEGLRRRQYKYCVTKYHQAMAIIWKPMEDYIHLEIKAFQRHGDNFLSGVVHHVVHHRYQ